MTSDELHQWMINTFGPTAGENAWQQFQMLPEQIRSQMLAANSSELPSPEQMRSLIQAFTQAGFSGPSASSTDADKEAENAKLATDPETGNPIGFQMPDNASASKKQAGSSTRPTAINVDLAKQIALISLPSNSQTVVSAAENRQAQDAFSAASLWLDSATGFNPPSKQPSAITRADWVTSTIARWARLVSPVAKATARALGSVFASRLGGNGEEVTTKIFAGPVQINLPDNLKDPRKLMETIGTASFSMQLGQSAASLATEVLGGFDQGMRLSDSPAGSLVIQNADHFAQGLSVPQEEVLDFLALRELATARLYANVPWLSTQIQTLVEKYAAYITIDLDAIEQQLRDAGEMTPQGLSGAVNISNVAMSESPEQKQAKASLGRMLALIEGWVDAVTWRAGEASLPHIASLREMMRRRRATGSPAEQTFRQLMGLDLRPVEARQACAAWEKIMDGKGTEAADALWRHPDTLPTFGAAAHKAAASSSAGTDGSGSADNTAASGNGTPSGHDWDASLDELLRQEAGKKSENGGADSQGSSASGSRGSSKPHDSGPASGSKGASPRDPHHPAGSDGPEKEGGDKQEK